MPSDRLHAVTLGLVRNRPQHMTYSAIAEGTGLSPHFVRKFAEGKNDSLSSNIQKLWEFMTGKSLDLNYPISPSHYR